MALKGSAPPSWAASLPRLTTLVSAASRRARDVLHWQKLMPGPRAGEGPPPGELQSGFRAGARVVGAPPPRVSPVPPLTQPRESSGGSCLHATC